MKNKWIALLLIVGITIVSACSNQSKTGNKPEAAANNGAKLGPFDRYDQTVTLSIGKMISTKDTNLPNGDTVDNNEYYRYVEKKLNVKVTHAWQVETPDAYQQKVSVSIGGGIFRTAFIVDEQQLKQLVEADLIEDLSSIYASTISPLIKGYYDSYGDRVLKRAKFDGKLMAFPNTFIAGENEIMWIRKDWLDKLGLQLPERWMISRKSQRRLWKKTRMATAKMTLTGLRGARTWAVWASIASIRSLPLCTHIKING
nr:extracellular solute-binding protein [Paenibacillus sp. VKM B-2647]